MPADRKLQLPVRLLVLDMLGSLVLAAGLYELFVDDHSLFPPALRFPGYALVLIGIGLVIMLPAVLDMVKYFREQQAAR